MPAKHERDIREIQNLLTRAILLLDQIGNDEAVLCLIELKRKLTVSQEAKSNSLDVVND